MADGYCVGAGHGIHTWLSWDGCRQHVAVLGWMQATLGALGSRAERSLLPSTACHLMSFRKLGNSGSSRFVGTWQTDDVFGEVMMSDSQFTDVNATALSLGPS